MQEIIVQSVLCLGLIYILVTSQMPSKEARVQRKKDKEFKKQVNSNYKKIMDSAKK